MIESLVPFELQPTLIGDLVCLQPLRPEHYDALSRSPGFRPAPYLARAKWVSVDDPKALTDREMKAYIKRAHAVIAAALPRKKQADLRL